MKIIKTLVLFWIGTYSMTSFANQINFADRRNKQLEGCER